MEPPRQGGYLRLQISSRQSVDLHTTGCQRIASRSPLLKRAAHGQVRPRKAYPRHREPADSAPSLRLPLRRQEPVHGPGMVRKPHRDIQHTLEAPPARRARRRLPDTPAAGNRRPVWPACDRPREIRHQDGGHTQHLHTA